MMLLQIFTNCNTYNYVVRMAIFPAIMATASPHDYTRDYTNVFIFQTKIFNRELSLKKVKF